MNVIESLEKRVAVDFPGVSVKPWIPSGHLVGSLDNNEWILDIQYRDVISLTLKCQSGSSKVAVGACRNFPADRATPIMQFDDILDGEDAAYDWLAEQLGAVAA